MAVTSSVNVSVVQTPTVLSISPASATVAQGATQQFTATIKDQFGNVISGQTVTWVATLGTITSTGLYTGTTVGSGTVTATSGSLTATVNVTVSNAVITIVNPATAVPNPVLANTTNLSVLASSTNGESTLSYTWSVTGPTGATPPTFSANGTNAAKNTTATFTSAGNYTFTVSVS